MKLNIIVIVILGFSILFVTNQAYAPCIEGPGINCNNYPPPALTQISTDKLNYEISDKPIITIMGAPDAIAHLEIDDSSSNIIFTHDINLAPIGTAKYVLDISSYKPGVYSAIATSPISKLTSNFAVGLTTTGGSIMLNTDKNSYFPGDNVTIFGWWNSNTLIQLSLVDPNGVSVKSMQIFSDKTGHFSSLGFSIPHIVTPGTWKIYGTSGVNDISVNIAVENIPGIQMNKTNVLSPLKQYESGLAAKDVKCNSGLWLVIKAEDGSPACVRPDTAYVLIHSGWAKEVSQTSLYTMSTASSVPCDISYPRSNVGVAVLYMVPNSTGKICATYHNPDSPIQSSARVFTAKDVQQQASEINISAHPDIVPTGNSTIVYTIKTGNQAGLYGISFFCNSIPFAVGYDNQSRIILDDFPWLYENDICLSQTNVFQITGLSGIHVKYVTEVHRN